MNATGILLLIVGVFLIINAGNILQVFQGNAKINIATGNRSGNSQSSGSGSSSGLSSGSAPKGQA